MKRLLILSVLGAVFLITGCGFWVTTPGYYQPGYYQSGYYYPQGYNNGGQEGNGNGHGHGWHGGDR